MTLTLELVEISGRVRFGVSHSSSYVTFLEEPHTRFAVHSEVGGDSFKVKDIPKLSEYIVKKLKDFILRRFVHPSSHRFRLIWPRNWWPEDVQCNFPSSNASPPKSQSEKTSGFTGSDGSNGDNDSEKWKTSGGMANNGSVPVKRECAVPDGIEEKEIKKVIVPLSSAAAALASLSSTTGWLRDEVRRRNQPVSCASTPAKGSTQSNTRSGSIDESGRMAPSYDISGLNSNESRDSKDGESCGVIVESVESDHPISPPSDEEKKVPSKVPQSIEHKWRTALGDFTQRNTMSQFLHRKASSHPTTVLGMHTVMRPRIEQKEIEGRIDSIPEYSPNSIEGTPIIGYTTVSGNDLNESDSNQQTKSSTRITPQLILSESELEPDSTDESFDTTKVEKENLVASSPRKESFQRLLENLERASSPRVAESSDLKPSDGIIPSAAHSTVNTSPIAATSSTMIGEAHVSVSASGDSNDQMLSLQPPFHLAVNSDTNSPHFSSCDTSTSQSSSPQSSGTIPSPPVVPLNVSYSDSNPVKEASSALVSGLTPAGTVAATAAVADKESSDASIVTDIVQYSFQGNGRQTQGNGPHTQGHGLQTPHVHTQQITHLHGQRTQGYGHLLGGEEKKVKETEKDVEKEKVPEKHEWFNKLGEAKEKLQNKFQVFKSKLAATPPTPASPQKYDKAHDKAKFNSQQLSGITISSLSELFIPSTLIASPSSNSGLIHVTSPGLTYPTVNLKNEEHLLLNRGMSAPTPPKPTLSRMRSSSDASQFYESRRESFKDNEEDNNLGRTRRAVSEEAPEPVTATKSLSDLLKGKSRTLSSANVMKAFNKAMMTPQERRYNMYRSVQDKRVERDKTTDKEEEVELKSLERLFVPLLAPPGSSISDVSPSQAVLNYEKQLTGAECSESSFSPGESNAVAPVRVGILKTSLESLGSSLAPLGRSLGAEDVWAELSGGGKLSKSILRLYFIGEKREGVESDSFKKSVSFKEFTDENKAIEILDHVNDSTGSNSGNTGGTKMVLAASYDLHGAECHLLPSVAEDSRKLKITFETPIDGTEGVDAGESLGGVTAGVHLRGFEVQLGSLQRKDMTFWCASEEECGDWIDAIDNISNS